MSNKVGSHRGLSHLHKFFSSTSLQCTSAESHVKISPPLSEHSIPTVQSIHHLAPIGTLLSTPMIIVYALWRLTFTSRSMCKTLSRFSRSYPCACPRQSLASIQHIHTGDMSLVIRTFNSTPATADSSYPRYWTVLSITTGLEARCTANCIVIKSADEHCVNFCRTYLPYRPSLAGGLETVSMLAA